MKASDFNACTYNGEIYCIDCLPNCPCCDHPITTNDPSVSVIFASDEVDSYPICSVCGTQHTYPSLTSVGVEHEAESRAILEGINIFEVTPETYELLGKACSKLVDKDHPDYLAPGWYYRQEKSNAALLQNELFGPFNSYQEACQDLLDQFI